MTDGLDGLAISQTIIISLGLLIVSLTTKMQTLGIEEISLLCSLLIGSSLGFLQDSCSGPYTLLRERGIEQCLAEQARYSCLNFSYQGLPF